jgi:hypothetical protein
MKQAIITIARYLGVMFSLPSCLLSSIHTSDLEKLASWLASPKKANHKFTVYMLKRHQWEKQGYNLIWSQGNLLL